VAKGENVSTSTEAGAGGRSLRSTAMADDESTTAMHKSKGEVSNSVGAGNTGNRKKTSTATGGLDYALPEHSMRVDFLEIVRDLHSRAAGFENSQPKVHWYIGTLVHWYIGTLVHWYIGTLVH
jgi:hypothetical protein